MLATPKPEGGVPALNVALANSPDIKGVHDAAYIFPLPNEKQHAMMVESIRCNGLLCPIMLTEDNLLLDGKWRVLACYEAGVDLLYVVMHCAPLALVISMNLYRMNMTDAQIAEGNERKKQLQKKFPLMR